MPSSLSSSGQRWLQVLAVQLLFSIVLFGLELTKDSHNQQPVSRADARSSWSIIASDDVRHHSLFDRQEEETVASLDEYELVFADEFDSGSVALRVDQSKWRHEEHCGRFNNELQCYTSSIQNSFQMNGHLHIVARLHNTTVPVPVPESKATLLSNRTKPAPPPARRFEFTSARLNTQGLREFRHGRVRASIKLPLFRGAWSAFWMLGADIDSVSWPRCTEIDIFEAVNREGVVHSSIHFRDETVSADENLATGNISHSFLTAAHLPRSRSSMSDDFHLYEVIHTPSTISFLFDERLFYSISLRDNPVLQRSFANNSLYFLLLNLAIGGDWPGHDIDRTAFPATMLIDYVRVYARR